MDSACDDSSASLHRDASRKPVDIHVFVIARISQAPQKSAWFYLRRMSIAVDQTDSRRWPPSTGQGGTNRCSELLFSSSGVLIAPQPIWGELRLSFVSRVFSDCGLRRLVGRGRVERRCGRRHRQSPELSEGKQVAKGLCVRQDGMVLVEYGSRNIAIAKAQYRANGYRPPLEKLPSEPTPLRVRVPERLSQKSRIFGLTPREPIIGRCVPLKTPQR